MQTYKYRHSKFGEQEGFLTDGKVAVGAILGLVISLAFSVFSGGMTITDQTAGIVSLLVAVSSVFIASKALSEQKRAREASTDPVVIPHFGQREDAPELVTFNLSNVGAGAAMNVRLLVKNPEPDGDRRLMSNIFKTHHPISVILQGKSIGFSLGIGFELLGENPLPPFVVHLSYEDLIGNEYSTDFELDIRELDGFGANKGVFMRGVSALESIAKKL